MSNIPEGYNLFIVDIEYCVPMKEVEPHMEGHMTFVAARYEAGTFLASGPKVPRTGGVVLATAQDKETLDAALAADPFVKHKLAIYTITEFMPRRTVKGL